MPAKGPRRFAARSTMIEDNTPLTLTKEKSQSLSVEDSITAVKLAGSYESPLLGSLPDYLECRFMAGLR